MSRFNFRNDARQALQRAQALLATGSDAEIRYAALELRFAIEAIIYGKAEAFETELPLAEYREWRPKQILQALLEIDPMLDQPVTLRVGQQPERGVPPDRMKTLGSETPLDLGTIRRHYDAMGSFLHSPTVRQLEEGKGADPARMRARCEELVAALARVLASPIYNINMGNFSSWPCERCGATVRRRLPREPGSVEARCAACNAPYIGFYDGEVARWERDDQPVTCLNPECGAEGSLWVDQLKEGAVWSCFSCGKRHRIALCIEELPGEAAEAKDPGAPEQP